VTPTEDVTLFPWRISDTKEVILPITFLVEECHLSSGDHVRIEIRHEGLAFTPIRKIPPDIS